MKLRFSLWAEDLRSQGDLYAVVTILRDGETKPEILGKTEVIAKTKSPDWTKVFLIHDFQLGEPMRLVVNIYRDKHDSVGSTVFDVGRVLGSPGSIMGKQIKGDGGLVVATVESALDTGSLRFRLRALDLINTEGVLRKPDPFFELQRLRKSTSGSRVWDTVFRSPFISDTLDPIWGESYVELAALCGTNTNQKFRLALYDHESSGKHVFMGDVKITVDELVQALTTEEPLEDSVSRDKAIPLKLSGKDAGVIVVVEADLTKPESTSSEDDVVPVEESPELFAAAGDDEEIDLATPSEEITMDAQDINTLIAPTFANYVSGGCQLHVMVAIDATASNGDPRKSDSLHSFEGQNDYHTGLRTICQILSKYDSDQLYPVYGFGSKIDGEINHCFPLSPDDKPVSGVDGILSAYDKKFKSGLVMSSPRDYSEVIRTCTQTSLDQLDNGHAYSILLIFTNGDPADFLKTTEALKAANDAPLSIVVVGIGEGSFSMSESLEEQGNEGRDKIRFVNFAKLHADRRALTAAALDHIPSQLETYFKSRKLYPNPEQENDEIVVEPYNEATDDIDVPIQMNENGDPVVTGEVQESPDATQQSSTGGSFNMSQAMQQGQQFMKKHKKQIGRVTRKFNREVKREIKKKLPKAARFFV